MVRLHGPDGRLLVREPEACCSPLPSGLDELSLQAEAKRRMQEMLNARVGGSEVDRLSLASSCGDDLVVDFVQRFLALAIEYLVPDGRWEGSPATVTIGARTYRFSTSREPYPQETVSFHLLAESDSPSRERPKPREILLEAGSRYARARLYVPRQVRFAHEHALRMVGALFETGQAWLRKHLGDVVFAFGSNLAPSLYRYVRHELGGNASDEHLLFATLPAGRGGQIVYLVDDVKVDQMLNRVMGRARSVGESPVTLVSELLKNNVEYERIHARHAVQRNQPTDFDLRTSLYRNDHDTFNEAEIGWYQSARISIFPFLNTESECLMAVCGIEERERVASQLPMLQAGLGDRFRRHRDEAIQQLDLLNGRRHAPEPVPTDLPPPQSLLQERAPGGGRPTIVLDTESKERILVGEVIAIVARAGQICREKLVSDHGIDMEIEFKDDNREATGKMILVQLKSGDSYLRTRKRDGEEIFAIKDERHARYWVAQAFPVLLVIRNSKGEIRWMEIRDWLKRESEGGTKPVKQIVFRGECLDELSVQRWRHDALHS
jgi:hypothetical protein